MSSSKPVSTWASMGRGPRALKWRLVLMVTAIGATTAVACKDGAIPNLNAPQVGLNPAGVEARMLSVLAVLRGDMEGIVLYAGGGSRDVANFTTTDNRFITEWAGDGVPLQSSDFYSQFGWPLEYTSAKAAVNLIADLPKVTPAYSTGDLAKLTGILETFKALGLMYVIESHDTLGAAIDGINHAPQAPAAPILCNRAAWRAIVALLDSANAQLNTDPSPGLPVALPSGFAAVSGSAGPSTAAGSFASFNRALAGKANLELAYAIARSPGGTPPTPSTAGSPDAAALASADSAIKTSALFNIGALAPPAPGDFSDPLAVYFNFSGASGDLANVINNTITTVYVMKEADATIDPADKRRAKLVPNKQPAGTAYAAQASPNALTLGTYQRIASPMPIIRNEELVLLDAEVQLGLGNINGAGGAVPLLNTVRASVGGLPAVVAATYVAARNAILAELRPSLIGEPGQDRVIAIRNYGLQAVADTTWGSADTHSTLLPIPNGEANARNGNTATVCP